MAARVLLLALWGTIAGPWSAIVLGAGLAFLVRYDRGGYTAGNAVADMRRRLYRQS